MTTSPNKRETQRVAKHRLRLSNLCHLLATGFGSGLSPRMPGTIGSLAAIPVWCFLSFLPWQLYSLMIMLSIFIGLYLCHQTAKDIGVHDHSSIVWDEFVGMWITLMAIEDQQWKCVLASFLAFRVLDIFKPWPIYWFDRTVHGGMGIMLDDVVAGLISAGIIYWIVVSHRSFFS
ncbi:MAG: phosphatidylglycerophosphatase A [Candidatus Malihini olakiniferum]